MDNFLIYSYPRSGNTLLRLLIEECFNYRTYGYTSKIDIAPLKYTESGFMNYAPYTIGYKRHGRLSEQEKNMPMIYIERDIDSAIESQVKKTGILSRHQEQRAWICMRINYELHQQQKICIDFKELTENTKQVVLLLEHFFGHQSFEKDVDGIKHRAKELYKLEYNGK